MKNKIEKTDSEWKKQLNESEYHICRKKGTERAFTGKYWNSKDPGIFHCVCCGNPLFDASAKFDSGTGWPSFFQPVNPNCFKTQEDNSLLMQRTEVMCSRCDSHLGHIFEDGPTPTGLRYCINSTSLKLVPQEDSK